MAKPRDPMCGLYVQCSKEGSPLGCTSLFNLIYFFFLGGGGGGGLSFIAHSSVGVFFFFVVFTLYPRFRFCDPSVPVYTFQLNLLYK